MAEGQRGRERRHGPARRRRLALQPSARDEGAFGSTLDSALDLLAVLVGALRAVEGPVLWNVWLHSGPHVEVVPRLSTFAGIELSAGIFVLTVGHEDAAAALRGALPPR